MALSIVIAAAFLVLAVVWLRGRFAAVLVTGRSMEPAYRHGERVLVRRSTLSAVRAGDVVVLAAPDGGWMIKRAVALPGDPVPAVLGGLGLAVPVGALVVLGDNAAHSDDSRRLGFLDGSTLFGVVVGSVPAARHQVSGRASPPVR